MRILITGGSGFLGRALTAFWREHHTVCIYSRSESAQAAMAPHPNVRPFIGDVRDRERLRRAMEGCDAVIHAAALKRIEVGHYNPDEVKKTNIDGTENAVIAARDAGVGIFVYTSTDKAWRPKSAYGVSKAYGELFVLAANVLSPAYRCPKYRVTRYGNVMGSTGSVVGTWRLNKAAGKRSVLTDPEATRFWMGVDEAVQLVDSAVKDTSAKEVYIPWLPAFRLGDLAEAMEIDYDVIGLPSWEKKHEGLDDMNRSDIARRMTIEEIRERLKEIP